MTIRNTEDFLIDQLNRVQEAVRLVVLLDPERRLQLGEELRCKRRWRVYQYSENDLDFRARYRSGPADPNEQHIVWITASPFRRAQAPRLDLSYLGDVLRRAERVFDLSLAGVLRTLIPGETFPEEGLRAHGEVIGNRLDDFVAAHRELRRQVGARQALALRHVRALVIKCLQPNLSVEQSLIDGTDLSEVLQAYLTLVWSEQVNEQVLPLLRLQVMSGAPTGTDRLRPWLDAAPDDVALAIYLYRLLRAYAVPNPLNQLRGLNLINVDTTTFQPLLESATGFWDNSSLRPRLISRAEAVLPQDRLSEIIGLLPFSTIAALIDAMQQEEAPAILYGLAERLLGDVVANRTLAAEVDVARLSATQSCETQYTGRARAVLTVLQELAFVQRVIDRGVIAAPDLASLVDGYVGSGAPRLELACAIISAQAAQILSVAVRRQIAQSLDALSEKVREYLANADASLVGLVAPDPAALWRHPRLSTNVLNDLVLRAGAAPTAENALWILLFDGMRWDSWSEIIRPLLLKHFEIASDEKPYLSALPSTTSIARTAFFAGCAPGNWRAPDGRATDNEQLLLARLLDLSARDAADRIRFETRSEHRASRGLRPYDLNRRPVNVLIYKVSDGWIHEFQGDLVALNNRIAQQVEEVVADLEAMIADDDVVVLSSDHGFTELDASAKIPVSGPVDQIVYRYLTDLENPAGLRVSHSPDRFFTVAKARTWFQRERWRYTRYSHGGATLAEMVVPGLVLRKISQPAVELQLTGLHQLGVDEKQPSMIGVRVKNAGNRPTTYTLAFTVNTEPQGAMQRGALGPQEARDHSFGFTPVYSPRKTERATLIATYVDVDGRERSIPPHYVEIETRPRSDVVEIDFGGLDKLDDL